MEEVAYKPISGYDGTLIKDLSSDKQTIFVYPRRYISKTGISSSGATVTLYTVPVGFYFVLLNCSYNATGDNGTGMGNGSLTTSNPDIPYLIRIAGAPTIPATTIFQANEVKSFGDGIVFKENVAFQIVNGSSPAHSGTLIGYEVDKNAFNTKII